MIPLIALVEITAIRLESKSSKGFFFTIKFPPMRALKFITDHVIFKLWYNQTYQMKTTFDIQKSYSTHSTLWVIINIQFIYLSTVFLKIVSAETIFKNTNLTLFTLVTVHTGAKTIQGWKLFVEIRYLF